MTPGTGARTVLIEGLDENYDIQSETVTMDGTTNVVTTNTYIRLFRMTVQMTQGLAVKMQVTLQLLLVVMSKLEYPQILKINL